jgi:hypothetical protein
VERGRRISLTEGRKVIGSQAVGAWIARLVFWLLLALGIGYRELSRKSAVLLVALWLVGYIALPRISWLGGLFFSPYVAVLDIVLVFFVFKRDVRLT